MQELIIKEQLDSTLEVRGALGFDERPGGISPRRLPDWARPQIPQLMDVVVRMPSGVRLRFETDSATVGLGFHATAMQTLPQPRRPINFNLETADGLACAASALGNTIVLERDKPGEFELLRGPADQVEFSLPGSSGGEMQRCELWLPHNAFIELDRLLLEDGARIRCWPDSPKPKWLHYGSSISHCMEALEPALTWPAVAARTAQLDLHNLGLAGQCHLDPFVARTIAEQDADIISLKVGINLINMDSMRERVFVPALHGFLDLIREKKPTTPIVLISPIFCPSAETNPGPTLPDADGKFQTLPGDQRWREGCMNLQRVRTLITRLVKLRTGGDKSEGGGKSRDKNLHYVDGLSLFGETDRGDLPDDLHPNPEGYLRMGERFAPTLQRLLA